ncbi:MAG: hypothetical protein CL535_16250 [Ahrensia sp.]|nr:hypothetical protein [Ahrensia sp.]MBV48225.1 hypothetical protein [Roseobacter sp.]|tara:strand:- start:106138 stop:106578 length:441 start_codon:yes stop_codon:yes gene_type:complete
MTDYSDIIDRLEKADGPSRELDSRVWVAANPDDLIIENDQHHGQGTVQFSGGGFARDRFKLCEMYTASLDAAIALTEKLLPEHGRMHSKGRLAIDEPLYGVKLYEHELCVGEDPHEIAEAEHDSEPIAILIALFRALQAHGRTDNQ